MAQGLIPHVLCARFQDLTRARPLARTRARIHTRVDGQSRRRCCSWRYTPTPSVWPRSLGGSCPRSTSRASRRYLFVRLFCLFRLFSRLRLLFFNTPPRLRPGQPPGQPQSAQSPYGGERTWAEASRDAVMQRAAQRRRFVQQLVTRREAARVAGVLSVLIVGLAADLRPCGDVLRLCVACDVGRRRSASSLLG